MVTYSDLFTFVIMLCAVITLVVIIIYLPREPLRCYANRRTNRKEVGAMVTYSDLFTFVIMLCAVITLVVTIYRHKK